MSDSVIFFGGYEMRKEIISSNNAPAAIGPYSQAVKSSDLIFISGQLPVNAATGEMPADIVSQTKQVIENINAILNSQSLSLNNVVKTTVFLKDLNDFSQMNKIYEEFFNNAPPARSTIEVSKIPKGALIEIDAIAVI